MRPYQVVVWGASSFVGRLVCEHIARDYQGQVRWAMSGRTQAKLDAVKEDLVKINPACKDVPILIADATDQSSVNEVASKTDVLLTTVGPYAKFGIPVVQACAEFGTHYCDLTGEPQFMRDSIRQFDAIAKQSGAKIVHSCGYDSVPSDVTTLETVHFALQKFGRPPDEVVLIQKGKGGVSGGTIDSFMGLYKETADTRNASQQPYCLDPPGSLYASGQGPDQPSPIAPMWSDATKSWTGPFVMAIVNEPVVRRSNALMGYLYGKSFHYSERGSSGNYLVAMGASLLFVLLGAVMLSATKVPLLRKMLPAAGEGPSKETQISGFLVAKSYGLIKAHDGKPERRFMTSLQDTRDPGYLSTSRMILEVALCMALDQDALAKDEYASKNPAGILTPASALGRVLARRLTRAGYTLDAKEL